jgi:serine/threonine protein kinase
MSDAAHTRGEIWGTPYYIAPEKLDHQSEDFRSDIYSLGGTLFHALAGRPPYEAEKASAVALKQLMSQPVSLQTFAPDVSSETAYVINRMLAKDPDQRYASYQELIEHLSHAHRKVLERSQQPQKLKERVVLESQSSKTLSGLLSLGLLAILVASCILIFGFGKTLFEPAGSASTPSPRAEHSSEVSKRMFLQAVQLLAGRQADKGLPAFDRLLALEPVRAAHEELDSHERRPGRASWSATERSGATLPGNRKRRQLLGRRTGATPGELPSWRPANNLQSPNQFPPRSPDSIRMPPSSHLAFSVLRFTTGTPARLRMLVHSSRAS